MTLSQELFERGLIEKTTSEELLPKLDQGGLTFYVGFDPTADSLHVGQLAVFNLMALLQAQGHSPVGLMGGATGMIGDPGGKSQERNLLSEAQLQENIQGIAAQIHRFLAFEGGPKARIVNNYDWFKGIGFISFLRDIGKHFSVNQMIQRDSVKSRLEREGAGISYTEFSYMLLQAYDFVVLFQNHGVTLQLGGADQWGNIVSGIDLGRRLGTAPLYGLTLPLITKGDGQKFGKSESGTVWLSPEKTSPYEFYQFFLNQADEDVVRFLKVLTQVPLAEIKELEAQVLAEPHKRAAQKRLAEDLTRRVHGPEALAKVQRASKMLFGEKISDLDEALITQIFKDVPSVQLERARLEAGLPLIDALFEVGAAKSKGEARKLIQQGGAYVNNEPQKELEFLLRPEHLVSVRHLVLRTGKKNYALLEFS
ncbi:MAG: tyrosine--tRNA ligase [Candidatus Lambdaproteobacteria bacterium RIFOXYD1_FULL_56_27]|uniref:Tyrosine--tRNA ligase n=1 Tax=Candidatus Lambdaproteobacteria bacterium RIFOXYD2_FULL_56_26 TaxID=1817773 RepID=A0A1F6GYR7_9PROT|nr:MAG: tyrosine--tRNA ligase [Candidatus Lambdaproteobacteria bacterium RIFOXYC1_FULL_56_13]OGH03316.1 MAG: tyrosine--tRNA ligase [Candidatus Lambdaproteobacteria bacterium RIFOXYD2_FULL_56_26]OGH06679.1 MAG: tyrosine--tRNA ligase [Candidatus Lambdaproteobacteria bacterium RIFOXYD1_FULL_56_27]